MVETKDVVSGLSYFLGVDEQRALVLDIIAKRNESYTELWGLVGDICPPKLMGGAVREADAITRQQMLSIANGIDQWYRKHGAILDSLSRLWLISLRELCFSWLAENRDTDKALDWNDPTWADDDENPKAALHMWLVKTALRISLHHGLMSTDIGRKRVNEAGWMAEANQAIAFHLLKNYRVVYEAWRHHEKLKLPRVEDVKQFIIELLDIPDKQIAKAFGEK